MTAASKPLLPLVVAEIPASLRSFLSQEGISLRDHATEPAAGRFVLYDSRRSNRPAIDEDQITIDVDELRLRLGFDPFQTIDNGAVSRSVWQVGPWTASEETSDHDRAAIRSAVLDELRPIIEAHGGAWMRVGAVPHPYRTAFCFRFDHDSFVADDFAAVLDAMAGHESMTTHFVCASTHESHGDAVRRLEGCDVGSHGYHHHTYRTVRENVVNMARGIHVLESLGFEPSGFAAPHGRYHRELAAALAVCGITHGSEFAAAYDDWPFITPDNGVVQIPIHPVCLGIVLEAVDRDFSGNDDVRRRAAGDVRDYFLDVAERKRTARAPIFLYGHPDGRLGRYPQILRDLLAQVDGWHDMWKTNFTAFQQWWRIRDAIEFEVRAADDGYEIRASALPSGCEAALEWVTASGVARLPLDAPVIRIRRESTTFEPSASVELPQPIRREPIRGIRERLRRALDWEYVTPVGEIDAGPWRGKLKRTLRRWKELTR